MFMKGLNMQEIILSLIVPVYGVEAYLKRFLDSLEKNLKPEIEIILVDDGSKDNCGKIIDEFTAKQLPPHVSVVAIHKHNGGVSSARNAGLNIAKGEYVTFPDPDDYLADDYIESILAAINANNFPDLIIFDYKEDVEGIIKKCKKQDIREGIIDKENFIRLLARDREINSHVNNKVFKYELIKNTNFKENIRVLEDFDFFTRIALNLDSIFYLKKDLYFYYYRSDSLTKTMSLVDCQKSYELAEQRYEEFSKYYSNISFFPLVLWAHKILQIVYKNKINIDVNKYENFLKTNIIKILISSDITLNEKKQCLLVYMGIAKLYYSLK